MEAEILELYKNTGETPLECISRFRAGNPRYKGMKMTYLGRLDPMAEGLLLVLAGNTRSKERYLSLDKTYEFEVLWGVSTDTYDVLGKVEKVEFANISEQKINLILRKLKAKRAQSYPPYSSRPVGGRPLFEWARENKIEEIDVPTRSIKIFSIEHIHTKLISGGEMLEDVGKKIALVRGDFRQEEILKSWSKALAGRERENFLISKFNADVSSGTYIRGLAHEMGGMGGVPALAYGIKRIRVGEYKI